MLAYFISTGSKISHLYNNCVCHFRFSMAGNKVNTKTKGKEDRSKTSSKTVVQTSEEPEDIDYALLRKPIHTSITGFGQARKIFDLATEEVS